MALSHIVMHVALCSSVVRQAANRNVPFRVVLKDRLDRVAFDQSFLVEHGEKREARAEFDLPFGVYRAELSTPSCTAEQYFSVLPEVNRGVQISLQDGQVGNVPVPAIVQGTAPFEFSYAQPVVMVFPRSLKCKDPIPDPLQAQIDMDNEPNSYYATIYPTPLLQRNAPVTLVVRLNDSHGGYQYLRVPIGDDVGYLTRWPALGQVNVTSDLIDALAGQPEDTLLCLRMSKITVGG
ncbi:MAG TPA: hypothetical protein VFA29_10385 [Candidatus Baltobacteraceae bacterium]|nr:hypothetical protein [Candidatus Baltobacteraceae bacterium]